MNYFRPRFRALDAMVYFFLFTFSVAAAFLIQFEFSIPEARRGLIASAVVLVALLKPPVFYLSEPIIAPANKESPDYKAYEADMARID